MSLKLLHPAIVAASHAMAAVYEPVIEHYCAKLDISFQSMYMLMAVPTFEPKPVNIEILNIRSPYTAPEHYHLILQELTRAGMLVSESEGQYRITPHGLKALKETMTAAYHAMGDFQSLPLTKQMDLASRLKVLSDNCLAAPDPPGTWCIRHARRLDPGSRVPMMARIDQFFSELRAFRDDAHLAAWRGIESNGHAWEILTHMWLHRASDQDEIFQALIRRGNSRELTQHTLELLIHRGWVALEDGTLRITPLGAEIRQNAENTTDRYYFAPFKNYATVELNRTIELIDELNRVLSIHNGG